jgi:hypothetical protein
MSDTTAFALGMLAVTGPGSWARTLLLTVAEMDDLGSWWSSCRLQPVCTAGPLAVASGAPGG